MFPGLIHFFRGPLDTPLAISLIFMIYNLVPQFLLLQVRLVLHRTARGAGWLVLCRVSGVEQEAGRGEQRHVPHVHLACACNPLP